MNEKILIVDDCTPILELMRDALTLLGYVVEGCSCGEDAFSIIRHNGFDLVICDLNMPGRGGKQLIEDMRAARLNIPIIIVSGYPEFVARADGLLHYDGYLEKPAGLAKMALIIRQVLDARISSLDPTP
jgi:DNA-binding response OmpR family regulator